MSNALGSLSQNQYLQASHQLLTWIEQSKANMDELIDTLPNAFAVCDQSGRILRGNNRLADLLGVDIEHTLGKNIGSLFSEEHLKLFRSKVGSLFQESAASAGKDDRQPSNVIALNPQSRGTFVPSEHDLPSLLEGDEFELMVQNGPLTGRTFVWSVRRFKSSTEGREWFTVFGRDVTAAKEYERKLSQIYSSIPLGILKIDENLLINESYSAYTEFLLSEKHLGGKRLFDILFKPAWSRMSLSEREAVSRVLSSIGSSKYEYDAVRPSLPRKIFLPARGEGATAVVSGVSGRWLGVNFEPILRDRTLEGFLVVLIDRTELETERTANVKERSSELEAESFRRFMEVRRLNSSLRETVYRDLCEYFDVLSNNLKEDGEVVSVLSSLASIKGTARLAGFTQMLLLSQQLSEKLMVTPELKGKEIWKATLPGFTPMMKEWDELRVVLKAFV